MGSKKAWGAAIGTVLAPGVGTAIGYSIGKRQDDKAKDKNRSKGVASATDDAAQDNSTGGEDPFADTTTAKKKKVNTLLAGSNVGALSGAGGSQGALTLGS